MPVPNCNYNNYGYQVDSQHTSMSNSNTPPAPGEITENLNRLAGELQLIDINLAKLIDILGPVLFKVPTSNNPKTDNIKPDKTIVGSIIGKFINQAQEINSKLSTILSECEL